MSEPNGELLQNDAPKTKEPRKVRRFYRRQNSLLSSFDQDQSNVESVQRARLAGTNVFPSEASDSDSKIARRLAQASLALNVCLLILKAVASALSGSLSIISSLVDSGVDITSGLVIWLTSHAIRQRDSYLYPRGRTRLEPLALVIISVIMAVASFQLIIQSVQLMIRGDVKPDVDAFTIGLMLATIATKLVLMVVCYRHESSPAISVLAMDHRNDCVSNSLAIICAVVGDKVWPYLDPIGAILVSIYIAFTWFLTGYQQSLVLSGRRAKPSLYNRIIKIAMEHDDKIKYIDTVHAYHFGTRFLVEIDIVVDAHMEVHEAHDLTEPLQQKIEVLDEVERCFLHIDYEFDHRPDYEHKVV